MELFQKATTCRLQNLYCCEIYDCRQGAWGWEVGIRMFSDLSANLSGSITDQPVWHMTSEVTTRRRKPFGSMSGGLSFSWSFSSNAVYQKSKVFVEKQAPAGKGAANVPHEGLRSYFEELYKVWPYELRWDMFSIFRSGLWVCVFETLLLLKNFG